MSDQAQPTAASSSSPQQLKDIETPHDHDVLSGRGNFVNYHPGNEHFRSLVRKHKVAYVACPKPQKAKFSRLIVDEIRARDPPGRFLKQDAKTKLWFDIGDKKALDKTRQALREGAPELLKELNPSDEEESEEFTPTPPAVQKDRFDATGGVARLNIDGGLPYQGMPHGLAVHSETQLPASSHVMNSDARHVHVPLNHPGRGVAGTMPINVHLDPSLNQNVQNVHSNQVTMNVAAATQNLNDLQKQLATSYPVDQLEPTPINPNLTMQIQEAQAQLNALHQQLQLQTQQLQLQAQSQPTGAEPVTSGGVQQAALQQGTVDTASQQLHRDDSLKFQEIFDESQKKKEQDKKDGQNSSALSGMSFSVGEMTVSEESNLSAVFEDSVRISDPAPKVPKEVEGVKAADASRQIPSSGTKQPSSKSMLDKSLLESFDMSTTTFSPGESQANLGSSLNAMQMSFTRVFDDSAPDFNKSK